MKKFYKIRRLMPTQIGISLPTEFIDRWENQYVKVEESGDSIIITKQKTIKMGDKIVIDNTEEEKYEGA